MRPPILGETRLKAPSHGICQPLDTKLHKRMSYESSTTITTTTHSSIKLRGANPVLQIGNTIFPKSPLPNDPKQPVIRSHSRNCATVSLFAVINGAAPPTILRGHPNGMRTGGFTRSQPVARSYRQPGLTNELLSLFKHRLDSPAQNLNIP